MLPRSSAGASRWRWLNHTIRRVSGSLVVHFASDSAWGSPNPSTTTPSSPPNLSRNASRGTLRLSSASASSWLLAASSSSSLTCASTVLRTAFDHEGISTGYGGALTGPPGTRPTRAATAVPDSLDRLRVRGHGASRSQHECEPVHAHQGDVLLGTRQP